MVFLSGKNQTKKVSDGIDDKIISLNHFLKQNISFNDDLLFTYERSFLDLLKCLLNDKKSKILFILKYVKVSSIWQLSNKFDLGYKGNIEKDIMQFEKYGVIRRLKKADDDYELIHKVWENLHPNARRTKTQKSTLYMLKNEFDETINLFLPIIYKKYIWSTEFSNIEQHRIKYERAYREEKAQFVSDKYIEDNKIGNCKMCNKTIRNDRNVKTPYEKIGKVIVCKECKNKKVTKNDIKRWLSE